MEKPLTTSELDESYREVAPRYARVALGYFGTKTSVGSRSQVAVG